MMPESFIQQRLPKCRAWPSVGPSSHIRRESRADFLARAPALPYFVQVIILYTKLLQFSPCQARI